MFRVNAELASIRSFGGIIGYQRNDGDVAGDNIPMEREEIARFLVITVSASACGAHGATANVCNSFFE